MDRNELKELLMTITDLYPASAPKASERVFAVWERSMKDVEYGTAFNVLCEYSKDSRYAPTISDIMNGVKKIEEKENDLVRLIKNIFVAICDFWGETKTVELYDTYMNKLAEVDGRDLKKQYDYAMKMQTDAFMYIKGRELFADRHCKEFSELGKLSDWIKKYRPEGTDG